MPIYEYGCSKCGLTTEVLQKVSDPAPVCPKCGSAETRRLVSQTSFVLKGTGWYATDYGGKNSGGGSSESKPS